MRMEDPPLLETETCGVRVVTRLARAVGVAASLKVPDMYITRAEWIKTGHLVAGEGYYRRRLNEKEAAAAHADVVALVRSHL